MKKFVFIVPIVLLLAAACGSNIQTGQNNADQPTTQKTNLKTLTNNDLVGIWQDSGSLGSGWGNVYQFFASGKYVYRISQELCDQRNQGNSGYWEIGALNENNQNLITLNVKLESMIVGGKVVDDAICGSGKKVQDGVEKQVTYNGQNQVVAVNECIDPEDSVYSCLSFNGKNFYKFSQDPTYENNSDLEKEPQFASPNPCFGIPEGKCRE